MSKKVTSAFADENALFVRVHNLLIRAEPTDGEVVYDEYHNAVTGYIPPAYELVSHVEGYPSHRRDRYDTLPELVDAMRSIAPLTKWRLLYDAEGESRA